MIGFNVQHPSVCTRTSAKLAETANECGDLQLLRTETILSFDPRKYPFADAVRKVLQIPPEQSLDTLHEVSEWHTEKNGNSVSLYQKIWNADRDRTGRPLSVMKSAPQGVGRLGGDERPTTRNYEAGRKSYREFEQVYRAFIAEVVAPGLGGGTVQFQRAPTLRVMVPREYNTRPDVATTPLHNDMDYHHQPSEINYWMPLSTVFDTNSLWIESKPGLADLHPLNLDYGEYCRFYGNQCRHQTHPNSTGKTRVSLDFRAVSAASGGHNPVFRKGKRRGAKARFQVCATEGVGDL